MLHHETSLNFPQGLPTSIPFPPGFGSASAGVSVNCAKPISPFSPSLRDATPSPGGFPRLLRNSADGEAYFTDVQPSGDRLDFSVGTDVIPFLPYFPVIDVTFAPVEKTHAVSGSQKVAQCLRIAGPGCML